MITGKTLATLKIRLEKAFVLCEQRKPEGFCIELGLYHVQGSNKNWYEIRAGRNEAEEFFIACTCRGALQGHGCYHAARAFELHTAGVQRLLDEKRKAERKEMDNAPYLKGGSKESPEKIGNYRV